VRIAIYYNHLETLGHTTRALSIVEALKHKFQDAEIIIFQGGKNQDFFWNNKFRVINLPDPLFDKKWFDKEDKIQKQKSRKFFAPAFNVQKTKNRMKFMLNQLIAFNPDVFIVEFFPFGRHLEQFEIIPILEILKKRNTRIVSCVGYPILPGKIKKLLEFANYFDKIFIHCPKEIDLNYIKKYFKNKPDMIQLYEETFSKLPQVEFTGYNLPPLPKKSIQETREELHLTNEKLILISRGGGAIFDSLIIKGILTKKFLDDNTFLVIITGPATTDKELEVFQKLANNKKIKIIKFTEDFLSYVRAADVHVCMSGYNTSIQNLYFNKRTIIIPKKDKDTDAEQFYRAEMLKELINASIIELDNLTPQILAQGINTKLNEPEPSLQQDWFNGAQVTAQLIGGLLNEHYL